MREVLIDTNLILRFLLADIPSQTQKSQRLFEAIEKGQKKGFLSILVINELIWILENFYKQKRENYLPEILKLLSLRKIKILEAKKQLLVEVLEAMKKSNLDFTDLYLTAIKKEKDYELKTFDKKLSRYES